jgi:hypothetical protein
LEELLFERHAFVAGGRRFKDEDDDSNGTSADVEID